MISCSDIGYLAAQALTKRDQYEGKTIEFANDELSIDEVAQAYQDVKGTRPDTTPLPQEALAGAGEDMNAMFKVGGSASSYDFRADIEVSRFCCFQFFREKGYKIDIPQIKKQYPTFITFKQWLQEA